MCGPAAAGAGGEAVLRCSRTKTHWAPALRSDRSANLTMISLVIAREAEMQDGPDGACRPAASLALAPEPCCVSGPASASPQAPKSFLEKPCSSPICLLPALGHGAPVSPAGPPRASDSPTTLCACQALLAGCRSRQRSSVTLDRRTLWALGSFYFLHESLKNIYQFDFKAKKYKKVTGKEIYSDTLESTPMLEKEKFPQDYFPECKWSRKGFVRTRWCVADCAFDLVNIHLFHDASNLVAWETSPSVYSGIRHKALGYVLDRIIDQRFENVSYFVFGDFNFRLDSKSVVETLCTKATMQTVRAADTNEVVKLIFRESDNDRKVMLQLEKKLFDYFNQEVFRDNNGTAVSAASDAPGVLGPRDRAPAAGTVPARVWRPSVWELLEFDKELSVFKDRLYELDISFPPSYPYSEDSGQGQQYMNTRCPAWCDRVLMSPSARELILKSESEEKVVTYDHIGPNVCMGDHKPVFLAFRIAPGAGKPHAHVHKCCVVQ
ncbi:hypothetical protein GH733_001273 [Mirounga leonina]|nr:hypothetical protein GH733_001273 [Mirounga leonina]